MPEEVTGDMRGFAHLKSCTGLDTSIDDMIGYVVVLCDAELL